MTLFIDKFDLETPPSTKEGLRFAVKDNIDVSSSVSTLGSAAFINCAKAKRNACVVDALLTAGYELLGKLNMHELAFGMTGVNQTFGTPENPLFPLLMTGGSSSASAAAVAANVVDISIGTDTGGSVRLPAACCAVIGFKPTYGRLSRHGVQPRESELDCVGPFARSVKEIELAMQAMDKTYTRLANLEKITIGVIDVEMSEDVRHAFERCIDQLSNQSKVTLQAVSLPLLDEAFKVGLDLMSHEIVTAFGNLSESKFGDDVAKRIVKAKSISAAQLSHASEIKIKFSKELDRQLTKVDAIIMPTLPRLPISRADALAGKMDLEASKYVRPFNVSGHPAISLPIGANQAPIGLQVVGKLDDDEKVCAIARYIETLIDLPNYKSISNGY